MNTKFLNKIAMFYPTNRTQANSKPIFHFTYETLPSVSILQFNVALTAINVKKKNYILNLKIINDENDALVDTNTPVDATKLIFDEQKLINHEYGSTLILITPPQFTISSKQHLYEATLQLLDSDGKIYDTNTTWFLTKED
ncbi:hypothetical protein L3C66_10195 [Lactiplantibacillus plantarum subsp. plantarum]|uniref:Uncharacterized protein n=1 Tax=Lactiplantibacillus plantarum TaxID=1590 RepID=A0A165RLK9_LACPN|nr:hypothetical protein [Lactiplantibacillus plantarum]KKX43709.1 hypothetical protein WH27_11645 [Lactiplantibacillus plantarum]KZU94612.1 hypothetical protein Lp19_2586 [Lactiplantibacillus plantarum]QSE56227.1 hypothetical protein JWR92_04890 [Lactiplantibacillus plantarum]QXN28080.1 hypothetical protein KVG01_10190 [Lactiplantibacillus plantarum subsp. plantarum]QXN31047.1 hypothetical protein KVG02_10190 [Lactiplantibacillus plantarum subsp. plantarum]